MSKKYRYVALGDSYTIGEGASEAESWPRLITEELRNKEVDIELVANPSVTGWTTRDLIEKELPVFDKSDANLITLLIGVNDWVQEVSLNDFSKNFNYILDYVQERIPDKSKILVITIPDFSVTPEGPKYSKGRNISEGLQIFNKHIIDESEKRNLVWIDLFHPSKEMEGKPDLIADDGLHPSSKTYSYWKEIIIHSFLELIKN